MANKKFDVKAKQTYCDKLTNEYGFDSAKIV